MSKPAAGGAMLKLLNRVTWALFKRETVGYDALGNKYYRMLDKNLEGEIIERRMVKYVDNIYDPTLTPPEWFQWLSKTRDVPTEEDILEGDQARAAQKDRAEAADAASAEAARRYADGSYHPEPFRHQLHSSAPTSTQSPSDK